MLSKKNLTLWLFVFLGLAIGMMAHASTDEPIPATPTSMSNVIDRPVPTGVAESDNVSESGILPVTPTSMSNVIDRPVPTIEATSQSNITDRIIPLRPTSRSNVDNQPVPTIEATSQSNVTDRIIPLRPTSRSNVDNEPVPTIEATSQSNVTDRIIPQATRTIEETVTEQAVTEEATEEAIESTLEETGLVAGDISPASPDHMDYEISALNPQGDIAESTNNLFWILMVIGVPIYIYVIGLVIYALFSGPHQSDEDSQIPEVEDLPGTLRFVVFNSVVLPAGILLVIFALILSVINTIIPSAQETSLTIEVYGEQWWWDVRYPEQGIVTANEIQIPAGEAVRIELRSDNVIHSFWVPELAGKMDMIPGAENSFWIHADEPGVYRGKCAEFCGIQHANMQFLVVALSPSDFEQWVINQQREAVAPEADTALEGQQVFVSAGCAGCHAVEGFDQAPGGIGPDLTHFASRRTIAAGIMPNTRGHLAGWISNPQTIKPGNEMPDIDLTGEELQSLLDYLQTLE
ncbi:MAG: cytochrome c oxidase subunit II [Aggregatilineales bacterium]